MKGKPWTVEEEKRLKELLSEKKSIRVVAKVMGKTRECIRQKVMRLGLEVVEHAENQPCSTTSRLALPSELYSVEEALLLLAGVMDALQNSGLDKVEILRLRSLVQAVNSYQARVAEFVDYRGIEARMAEMEEKYEHLLGEKAKDLASKKNNVPVPTPGES